MLSRDLFAVANFLVALGLYPEDEDEKLSAFKNICLLTQAYGKSKALPSR